MQSKLFLELTDHTQATYLLHHEEFELIVTVVSSLTMNCFCFQNHVYCRSNECAEHTSMTHYTVLILLRKSPCIPAVFEISTKPIFLCSAFIIPPVVKYVKFHLPSTLVDRVHLLSVIYFPAGSP